MKRTESGRSSSSRGSPGPRAGRCGLRQHRSAGPQPDRDGRYRHYDQAALMRLQRILLLRDLGLGLTAIAECWQETRTPCPRSRRTWNCSRRAGATAASHRVGANHAGQDKKRRATDGRGDVRRIRPHALRGRSGRTVGPGRLRPRRPLWRTLSDADKTGFQQDQLDIAAEFGRAHAAGLAPDSPEVLAITRRHYEWVAAGWQDRRPTADAFAGLGEMYVSDPRFAKHYDRHGPGTAEFVRDAMLAFAVAL